MDAVQNITVKWKFEGNFDQAEKEFNKLTKEEQELVHGFDQVNTAAKKTGDTIAKESTQAATNTGKVTKSVDTLNSRFSSLKNVVSSGFSADSIKQLGSEMVNVSGSTGKASVAMNLFKVALASTGVGLLVVALGALYAYFTKTEEGGDRAARAMRSLKVVVDLAWKALSVLGEYIAEYLVVWVEIFTQTYGALARGIGMSLQAFAALTDLLGMDGLTGTLQSAGDAMVGAEDKFRALKAEAEATGIAIANLEDDIDALTASLKVQNAELQTLIEKDLKALRNRTIGYKEALGVVEEIGTAEKEMLNNNISLNDKNIELWYRNSAAIVENKYAFYDLYKAYKEGRIGGEQYINMLNSFIDTNEKAGTLTQKEVNELSDLLVQREEYNRQSIVLNEKLENYRDALAEKDKARQQAAKQLADKRFQEQLKALTDEEKILIRQAQINGESDVYINQLKQRELDRRLELFRKYRKDETTEYKNLLLDQRQLLLDFDKLTDDEINQTRERRQQADKDANAQRLAYLKDANDKELAQFTALTESIDKADELAKAKLKARREAEAQAIEDLFKQIVATVFEIEKNQLNRQLSDIDTKKKAEIAAAGDSAQAKAIIENKYDQQERAIKRRQAIVDRQQALFNIGINTAQAVSKSLAQFPPPAGIPLALLTAGLGAAQAAAVLSKPIPQFNKGTRSVPGTDLGHDSVLAMLRPGEAVVPVDQNNRSKKLIDGIISGKIDDRMLSMNYSGIERTLDSINIKSDLSGLEVKLDQLNKTMKGLPVSQIVFDKKGYHSFVMQEGSRTEFMNNYFRN